jgi:hypothetical protein
MSHDPRIHVLALLLAIGSSCTAPDDDTAAAGAPPGWFLSGSDANRFRAAVDRGVAHDGNASGRLEAIGENVPGAATLMQSIPGAPFRGKRVRFSAALRTDGVARWAGLWMRVDRASGRGGFDNMQDRPVRGTTGWAVHHVVLDVAADATALHFGMLQDGPGVSHIDAAALEVVGADVAVTAVDRRARTLQNGGFEHGGGVPAGWLVSGFGADDVAITLDREQRRSGAASARLQSRVPDPRGRAMLLQSILAADHRGRRLRASAWLRGESARRAALLVQVMGPESGPGSEGLSRGSCDAHGTFDWTLCEVVLDVPMAGDTIHISADLEGRGALWVDDVRLEQVGDDVPVTWTDQRPRAPANLDFEAASERGAAPEGWFLSGGARGHYHAAVDRVLVHGGRASGRLEPAVASPLGYGTLMQLVRAADYRGKRLRMTAAVRGNAIEGRGDLWLRVQGTESPADGPGLGGGRYRLAGSFEWRSLAIVFDVPPMADSIQWGVGLDGRGAMWIDDVRLEEVAADVPLEHGDQRSLALENGGFENAPDRPTGWFLSGGGSGDFEAAVDRGQRAAGQASARLQPRVAAPTGYATLMQTIRADHHGGKRMRARAQLRARGVLAGDFWLRVQAAYSPQDGPGLAGGSCPLSGDSEWTLCEIVFDVPAAGEEIQLGAGLAGPGTIWLDQVSLEAVPVTVPLTGAERPPSAPTNLDFEAGAERP